MRANINERAKQELLEIMEVLGENSTSHVLNKLISHMHTNIVKTFKSEVNINDQSNTCYQE